MVHILCCDSDDLHRLLLVEQLNQFATVHNAVLGICLNVRQLEEQTDISTDIILCDIPFAGENSIYLMKNIRKDYPHIRVLFMSESLEYCEEIYAVEHDAFLRKPLTAEKLHPALKKAVEERARGKYLPVICKEFSKTVPFEDVLCVENKKRHINIITVDNFYMAATKYDTIVQTLDERFVTASGSCCVNAQKIMVLQKKALTLCDGTIVAIERGRYTAVRTAYQRYFG